MRCYHLTPNPPALPVAGEPVQWLEVAGNQALVVHSDCHLCQQLDTNLGHPLAAGLVGETVATALAQWGVLPTDTLTQAMLKVAADWSAAYP